MMLRTLIFLVSLGAPFDPSDISAPSRPRYWTRISSARYPGRPRVAREVRRLIPQMAQDGWRFTAHLVSQPMAERNRLSTGSVVIAERCTNTSWSSARGTSSDSRRH